MCLKAGPTLLALDWSNTTVDSVLNQLDQSEQRGLEFWASFQTPKASPGQQPAESEILQLGTLK